MAEIISFTKNQENEKMEMQKEYSHLFSRLIELYPKVKEDLDEKELMLYQKVMHRKSYLENPNHLTSLGLKHFLTMVKEAESSYEIAEFLLLLHAFYFTSIKKGELLKQEPTYRKELLLFFTNTETSYTNYEKMLTVFCDPMFEKAMDDLLSIHTFQIHHILETLIEEVDFHRDLALVLKDATAYVVGLTTPQVELEKSIDAIYDYYYNQLLGIELLTDESQEKEMKKLEKIKKLERLLPDQKETFFHLVFFIKEQYGLFDQIKLLLHYIDIFIEEMKKDNVVSFKEVRK